MTVREVKDALERNRLFPFLEERLAGIADLSLLDQATRGELEQIFYDFSIAIEERRKMGVEENGLSLLIAYSLELVQRINDNAEKSLQDLLAGK